jgi:hypothetical protein
VQLDVACAVLLEAGPTAAALDAEAALKAIHVLRVRAQELALGLEAVDEVVCARGHGLLARDGELGDEGVEDGGCFRSGKEARGEEVLASDEGLWVARLDERVEAVTGAEVLRVSGSAARTRKVWVRG